MIEPENIQENISAIEQQMQETDFWDDKEKAQAILQEYNQLKSLSAAEASFDRGDAVLSVMGGAGGQDAEDFARMLVEMYVKYLEKKGWALFTLHKNENDHGGYRNITIEIQGNPSAPRQSSGQAGSGRGPYGMLKNESGVHRLVRLSPFNAKSQRHTSFAMVEVIPKFSKLSPVEINEDDIEIEFSKSSGPGGQNVNKRETAVRIKHKETGITVHSDSERTQGRNKEKALELLKGKLYVKNEEDRKKKTRGMQVSTETSAEWGSQIRSYVLHPYKMVKDHRTEVEVRDVESVLDGDLDELIEAEKDL